MIGERRIANVQYLISKAHDTSASQLSARAKGDKLESEIKALRAELNAVKNYVDGKFQKVSRLIMDYPGSEFELVHELIQDPEMKLSTKELYALCHVSRSGYYEWLKKQEHRDAREEKVKQDFDLILTVYKKNGVPKGAKRIQMELLHLDPPVRMNLKKIRRLMAKFNLKCPIRKANPYRRMAKALKTNNVASNLVNREFEEHEPREILLTDITYLPYAGTFAYLSTILDSYTKQILAYVVSNSLQEDFVLETVNQLVERLGVSLTQNTLLHSDQGCHYASIQFIELVKKKKLRQSMSRKGNCWDNSP